MRAVILAAGRPARSARDAGRAPMPLAEIGGRPLIEHQLEFLFRGGVESASVCGAGPDYHRYLDWLRGCGYTGRVEIIDGAPNGEAGPLHDMGRLVRRGRPADGLVVSGGDRLFDFPLGPFLRFCAGRDGDVVGVTDSRQNAGGRCGTAAVTANDRVIEFAAPAAGRRRGLSAVPLVRLSSETAGLLERYLAEGNDGVCIGSFLEWTYRFRPLYACRLEGRCLHLDGPAALRRIASRFEKNRRI